ncbi:copper homeostasis protein CutC [Ancylomarina longa]|uniref:PF03932 family protein CutC n=1 Tax=Ancylomarina longa TaxID=2487017 RepID=A0A434ATH6_9BACT|nr:copper homeostasis protein CutC [Ancylomarina longa]RUT77630.1 copper homeostasis protein CutC [Ancylomarina longa]
MKRTKLEICCYSVQSAILAEKAGANRIELCTGIQEGGLTPSFAMIELCKASVNIPVHVIIRPRESDFHYSDIEFECMKKDILMSKSIGVDGIVSGVLSTDGRIDLPRTRELVELSKPMSFTFHRAFDMVKDPVLAMEQLIQLKVNRILTSGGMQTAIFGKDMLKRLVELAKERIIIMPGSGINEENILNLKMETGAQEFHCSAKSLVKSKMNFRNPNVSMGEKQESSEYSFFEANPEKIRKIANILKAEDINL